jgi:fatty acid desaturase
MFDDATPLLDRAALNAAPTASPAPGENARRLAKRVSVEVPTLLVTLIVYGGWLITTAAYGRWPLWVVAPVVVVLLTLHSSLQHEIIHGHPTRWGWFNRLLATFHFPSGCLFIATR